MYTKTCFSFLLTPTPTIPTHGMIDPDAAFFNLATQVGGKPTCAPPYRHLPSAWAKDHVMVDHAKPLPFHHAIQQGTMDTIRQLTKAGDCDVNAQDEEGNTPLHLAIKRNDGQGQAAFALLLERANLHPNPLNHAGQTPLDLLPPSHPCCTLFERKSALRLSDATTHYGQGDFYMQHKCYAEAPPHFQEAMRIRRVLAAQEQA